MRGTPVILWSVAAVLAPSPRLPAGGDAYPRPGLLAEPADLAAAGGADRLVVLDARARAGYDRGHIPGARWVDHAEWANGFGDGTDAAGWGKRIGGLGIGPEARVVVYDDSLGKDAARVWWVLRYWGVEDARLLNGGWKGWEAGRHPVDRAAPAPAAPVAFAPKPRADRLATKAELLAGLPGAEVQVVDARSAKEFCGADRLGNKRAGAIPGAKHLEWVDLVDKGTGRFKPAGDLRRLFAAAGVDLGKPTVTHCQSGGRAAVMAFGLELMGARDVSNYYKSWAEWGNANDTPVVTPPASKP